MPDRAAFLARKIAEIEKKYATYFTGKDFKVQNCVKIVLKAPISIHVINHKLPFDITCDIEEMFWIV